LLEIKTNESDSAAKIIVVAFISKNNEAAEQSFLPLRCFLIQ